MAPLFRPADAFQDNDNGIASPPGGNGPFAGIGEGGLGLVSKTFNSQVRSFPGLYYSVCAQAQQAVLLLLLLLPLPLLPPTPPLRLGPSNW